MQTLKQSSDTSCVLQDQSLVLGAKAELGLSNKQDLPDPAARSLMVPGWCTEVGIDELFELVNAMAIGALSLSLECCAAPVVACSDLFTAKRLHGGAWVETNACVVKSARVWLQVVPAHSSVKAAVGSVAAASTLALVSASLVATSTSASCEPVGLPPFVAQSKFRLGSKYQSLVLKDTACVTRLLQRLHKRFGAFTKLFGVGRQINPFCGHVEDMLRHACRRQTAWLCCVVHEGVLPLSGLGRCSCLRRPCRWRCCIVLLLAVHC